MECDQVEQLLELLYKAIRTKIYDRTEQHLELLN